MSNNVYIPFQDSIIVLKGFISQNNHRSFLIQTLCKTFPALMYRFLDCLIPHEKMPAGIWWSHLDSTLCIFCSELSFTYGSPLKISLLALSWLLSLECIFILSYYFFKMCDFMVLMPSMVRQNLTDDSNSKNVKSPNWKRKKDFDLVQSNLLTKPSWTYQLNPSYFKFNFLVLYKTDKSIYTKYIFIDVYIYIRYMFIYHFYPEILIAYIKYNLL